MASHRHLKLDNSIDNYPNSWYPVLESRSLKCNEVKALHVLGQDLIAYKGMSGKCYVFDAYCPHLGAHLAVGGTVIGDHIRCPFHGWTFNENGICTEVPGLECKCFLILLYSKIVIINFKINNIN